MFSVTRLSRSRILMAASSVVLAVSMACLVLDSAGRIGEDFVDRVLGDAMVWEKERSDAHSSMAGLQGDRGDTCPFRFSQAKIG
jgi:hypothetical protein